MKTDTDRQLLEAYANAGSEQAFRVLVERHIHLVHSAAFREARGNASLAEEITQEVFTELARSAVQLVRHPALAGWLYTCVRRMTANVRRSEDRRQRREQQAHTMNELLRPDPADQLWQQVRPELDDLMHELPESDRTAIVLRFFEGRSFKEVGLALGLTENAARMRVERTLEKMRDLLAQRGVKSTATTLGTVLAAGAVLPAPGALASAVATGALASAVLSGAGASTAVGLAKIIGLTKTQFAAAGSALLLIALLSIWFLEHRHPGDSSPSAPAQLPAAAVSAQAASEVAPPDDAAHLGPQPTSLLHLSTMTLLVADAASGEPIANAKLHLAYLRQDGRSHGVKGETDEKGELAVDMLQPPFRGLNLFVSAEGHVPKVISWGFGREMPSQYTMRLPRGGTISGVVVDDHGRPIPGAKIEFDGGEGNDRSLAENVQFGPDTVVVTDGDGHWSCNMIPREMEKVSLLVVHPDHAEMTATVRAQESEATNAVVVMKPGFTVAGVVVDAAGNPIEQARLREVRLNSEGERSKTTDASGAFKFRSLKAGELLLAVQANGFAPAVQTLQITSAVTGLRFQLGPGQVLRGRVTDEQGDPIADAWVETTRQAIDKVRWSTKTDGDGRFEWDSAPTEPLLYSVQAEGFNRVYSLQLPADGSEQAIPMTREQPGRDIVQITGSVVDAETGTALDAFKVSCSDMDPEWAFPFSFATTGQKGKFDWSMPAKSSDPGYQIQVEKEGYQPAVSAPLLRKDGNQKLAFKLQKGAGPSGVVLLPGGEPAVDAIILLCTPQSGVTLEGPARVRKGINTTTLLTQTDKSGRFALPAAVAPQGLIAVHEQGYAEVSLGALKAADGFVLQPWGRVEGRFMLEGQPAANERIIAHHQITRYSDSGQRFNFISYWFETRTDAAGNFSFDKVPPGPCQVSWLLSRDGRSSLISHEKLADVHSGDTTEIVLGGGGRTVVGLASFSRVPAMKDGSSVTVSLRPKTARDPAPLPRRAAFSSGPAYVDAMEKFLEAQRAQQSFWAFCEGNGSFRLADIPAGTYQLQLSFRGAGRDSVSPSESPRSEMESASFTREVIVPEVPAGESAVPMDLGKLELVPRRDETTLAR